MRTVKGVVVSGGIYPKRPADPKVHEKTRKALQVAVDRFAKELSDPKPARPSLKQVVLFRATRSSMKHFDEALPADKAFNSEKGWLTSSYYYSARLGPLKRLAGAAMDRMIAGMARKVQASKPAE